MAADLPTFDMSQAGPAPAAPGGMPTFDMSQAGVPAEPQKNGAFNEIGTGFARGALVDLPTLVGQAAQYIGAEPVGQALRGFGERMGARPGLQLNPEGHGAIVNALTSGAEMLPTIGGALAAGLGAVAAAPVDLPALAGLGIAAVPGAALFAGQAGQQTLEAAKAKGVSPDDAASAARLNAAATFASQVGLGMAGGKVLGAAGSALSRATGSASAPLAGDVLSELTGQGSLLAPVLKNAATGAAEAVGAGALQAGTTAAINNAYGIDDTSPLEAAKDQIGPMLGLSAVLTPFGLAGRALQMRAAANRTAILAHPDTSPATRSTLAAQYAQQLGASGKPEDIAAADAFRQNAQTAIDNKQPLPVTTELFQANTAQAPVTPEPPPLLENNPSPIPMGADKATPRTYTFPDGSSTNDFGQVQSYLEGLPDEQRDVARAKIFGFEPQVIDYHAAENPRQAATEAMREIAKAPNPDLTAKQAIETITGVDRAGLSKQAQAKRQADAAAAINEPSGVRTNDENGHERELSMGELYTLRAQQAKEAEAAAPREPNAPKPLSEITQDIVTANKTVTGEDTIRKQQSTPVQKQLDALGIDKLPTHDAQIDALSAHLASPDVKIGVPTRDRLQALLDTWKAERPALNGEVPQETPGNAPESVPTVPAAVASIAEPPPHAETLPANINASVETPAPESTGPENIPVAAPDTAPPPAAAEALGTNIPASRDEHIATALDTLNSKIVELQARQRAGETLPESDQDTLNDARSQRQIIANAASQPEARVTAALRDVNGTEPPPAGVFPHYRVETPEDTDPAIMYDAMRTGKLPDTLATIAKNGTTDDVRALAKQLGALTKDTTIRYSDPDGSKMLGSFDSVKNHINIFPGGESEATILHEATHAATVTQMSRASQIGAPRTQEEARMKRAFNDIWSIQKELAKRPEAAAHYGLTDPYEFVAELKANPAFRDYLREAEPGKQSMWTRTVNAIKRLLGLQGSGTYLERALSSSNVFMGKTDTEATGFPLREASPEARTFGRSYQGATKVVDEQYSEMTGAAKKTFSDAVNFGHVALAVYHKMLGWVTKQYIVNRLAAIPEMVQSGMAAAAAAHYKADETKHVVANAVGAPAAQYLTSTAKIFSGLKDGDKARALSQQMKIIGAEASRGGFDFRLNYNDNVKAGRELPTENKAYIDDIHRRYTQMQSNNPDAAKAIETGALQNARFHTMNMAGLVRNLIDASKDASMLAHVGRLDIMDPTLNAGRNANAAAFADGAHSELHTRIETAFADARAKLPKGAVLRDQLNELGDMYHAQQRDPYFSLGRSGDYFVKVGFQNMDRATADRLQAIALQHGHVLGDLMGGADHAFFKTETLDESTGLRRKLIAAGGDKIAPNSPASGKLADRLDSAYGVSPAIRSILATLHDTVEQSGITGDAAAAVRDSITRQVLSMLPETASRSAKMNRQGVPGYSADFLGDFQKRAAGGVQDLTNNYMQSHYTAARDGMADAIEKMARAGNAEMQTRAQMAADEINLRHTQNQQPMDNTVVNTINALGHTFYLAISPAYLIRTTAQPFHRGLPITGARFGFVQAARSLAQATSTSAKVIANTIADGYSAAGMRGVLDADASFKNLGLPAADQAFIQELHDRGVLNLGQARQIQSMPLKGTQRQQDLQRAAAMTAQYAEMGNRLVVALSAFRLQEAANAKKGVTDHAGSTEWAIDVAKRAMDDFESTNTARQIGKYGFAGKGTPLLTAFMNYSLQTMQQISRTVQDGMFNRDPSAEGLQRAKEARREFGGLMATTTMISGALGLPFVSVFAGLWNTFNDATDPNDPGDIRVSAQQFLNDTFGHTVGDVLAHGLPRAVGFDSSTFGLENLLPGSEFLSSRRLLADRVDELGKATMGPALSAGLQIFEAADKIKDGYVAKGIEAALPSGLKSYFKAAELATQGFTDSKGNPIGMEATPWDIGVQALGFKSAKAATQSELQSFVSARQDRLNYQRGLIEDQFYKGAVNDDANATENATQSLTQFNEANPSQALRDVGEGIRNRMRALALSRAFGGVSFPVRALPAVGSQLQSIGGEGSGLGMP